MTKNEKRARLDEITGLLKQNSVADLDEIPDALFWQRVDLQGERVQLMRDLTDK